MISNKFAFLTAGDGPITLKYPQRISSTMLLIKLGGSVITDKGEYNTLNDPVLQRLAGELAGGMPGECVVIHGAGSFGHILAEKYSIQNGWVRSLEGQLGALAGVQRDVRTLNLHVISALMAHDVPAISLPPSAFMKNRNGKLLDSPWFMDVFDDYLDLEAVPVSCGDVVPDTDRGFSIVSGDSIMKMLSARSDVQRAVFVTDVDGIFSSDPKQDPHADLIPVMKSAPSFDRFLEINGVADTSGKMVDVTGGISKKLRAAYAIARNGVEVVLLNGLVEGRLETWLKENTTPDGETVPKEENIPCTLIERCDP